jgi:DNA-binding GntR family transcriptional regulator
MTSTSLGAHLKPVTANFSLKDHVYGVLRKAILEMDIYDEGVDLRLDERRLAEQLGASRTPIREALARLEQEGFVEIVPRKGVYLRRKTLPEILETVVVWAALESMAAKLVTERACDSDIASLRALGTKHGTSALRAEISEYSAANVQFHQRIIELSGCKLLQSNADGLLQHMHAVRRRAINENNRVERSVVDHMQIIEAIETRDGDLASVLVRDHCMALHNHIKETWSIGT